jgi:hypothetical protein
MRILLTYTLYLIPYTRFFGQRKNTHLSLMNQGIFDSENG